MNVFVFGRYILLFLVFAITLATNIDDNLFARLGIGNHYGYMLAFATVCTVFLAGRHTLVVVAVVLFSINANMPSDFGLNFGYDRDYYAGLMAALLIQPLLMRFID